MTATADWILVGPLDELAARGVAVVQGRERPIAVFAHDGQVSAVDNRCPDMGYPLNQGTVKCGVLTCHWHQARFDLASGCTFDLWADDVPTFETRVEDGVVYVAPLPTRIFDREHHFRRLNDALEHNIGLIQAKSLYGLLQLQTPVEDIVREVALFGARRRDGWREGLTILTIVSNLKALLSDETLYLGLFRATTRLAAECEDSPPRRLREPLHGARHSAETLRQWFRDWVRVRHRDGAERILLTALERGESPAELTDLVFSAISDRVFADIGHVFDLTNKAFELAETIGLEHAADLLPTTLESLASSRGAEEDAHWHHPVELIAPLREVERRLPEVLGRPRREGWDDDGALLETLMGSDGLAILSGLERALADGAPAAALSRLVAYAAALRLAHFARTNDVRDWFNPRHTFSYAGAVDQAVLRSATPGVVRGVFHGALAVYMDRFLNVPPARLPEVAGGLDALPADAQWLRRDLLETLDRRGETEAAAKIVSRYLRLGHPFDRLVDTLALATLREDLDFHPLQVLEAGVAQYRRWNGGPQAEHVLVGVVRQLAAVCPTQRTGLRTTDVARRLHRGESLHEDE
ncbi:MAG: Rieske 2Fe-2S domain-containing protein [Planctomycetes bacterium]|nr:Rieske 2Fe-2S domain-containing protein [Planctomycetota bacterium]